jgi:deoxyuridine 5'-triphosphate nucleotidohydrolase
MSSVNKLNVTIFNEKAQLPRKAHPTDAGFDLTAINVENTFKEVNSTNSTEVNSIKFGYTYKVYTGLGVAIPPGYYGRIAPRSGLAAKHGITVLAGVIDENYTGEIIILLSTMNKDCNFTIKEGDKVAQLIIEKISPINEAIIVSVNSNNNINPSEQNTTYDYIEDPKFPDHLIVSKCINGIEVSNNYVLKTELPKLKRNNCGFGSTG